MKLFIAGFDTETNTFAPLPTGRRGFEEGFMAHGDATRRPENYCSAQLHIWRRRAEERGIEVVESLCTYAEPGGLIVGSVYEDLRNEILRDLKAAAPVDMVLLALHGAMAAEGCDDCEGDILARARAVAGPRAVIGAEFDLHAHLTETMVRHADILVGYKEYPHVDIPDRAEELFTLAYDAARGTTHPVMALSDCRMIGTFRTTEQPLRGFVDRMKALEGRDGILSVSLSHSFPWADNPDVGAKVLVVADGDRAKAQALADALRDEFFAMRRALAPRFVDFDAALDEALATDGGPVVIADVADNPGGGAPGDSTFCLRRMLERRITNAASGYYWDPMAVKFCFDAGLGARFRLRLGGKCGESSGDPVDLDVTVRGLAENPTQRFGRAVGPLGAAAWVEAEGLDLVLNSLRTQVFHPEGFAALGLDVRQRKIVVVKSIQHFHAGFAPIAARILYAATPGALSPDFANLPYTKHKRPYWPRVEDPFRQ
ncbi:M81 family metallopeptidase [Rhodoligotrophos defluvii]|uniref:M81 family metallopeptidase n=1 Tax=Rhodoligotrophos defluvii TaxID=2561934 RepID=UPI0010C9E23C|nr:M81 family metallopeptidase [Rhodoligotrophos defluvii]